MIGAGGGAPNHAGFFGPSDPRRHQWTTAGPIPGLFYAPTLLSTQERDAVLAHFRELNIPDLATSQDGRGMACEYSFPEESRGRTAALYVSLADKCIWLDDQTLLGVSALRYRPTSWLAMHQDVPSKYGDVFVVSVGAQREIRFAETRTHPEPYAVDLQDGSGYAMTGVCRREWWHSVPKSVDSTEDRCAILYAVPKEKFSGLIVVRHGGQHALASARDGRIVGPLIHSTFDDFAMVKLSILALTNPTVEEFAAAVRALPSALPPHCFFCRMARENVSICSGCQIARYCGPACQSVTVRSKFRFL
jgi:hypothetical protein